MRVFSEATEAARAVQRFFFRNEDDLPQIVQDKVGPIVGAGTSSVDQIVAFAESVYAAAKAEPGSISEEGLEIASGAADLIQRQGYHQRLVLVDAPELPRALGISNALRRIAGEDGAFPPEENDPVVAPAFVVAVEPPSVPA